MPDPSGFLRYDRALPPRRPAPLRLLDWNEVYPPADPQLVREQASRCMDCGIPFCHHGCPLGNRIPEWNELARTDDWAAAGESMHATNNFPEFTGRLCPAPCEASCVLGIGGFADPVAIKLVEVEIANRLGPLQPRPSPSWSGRSVAVVGSGPAGLAAAQQLARAGHAVTVYERDDAVGGLLRYGIPDFKLPKHHIDHRLAQLAAEGVTFVTGCAVGVDVPVPALRTSYDAVLLAAGALAGRDMPDTPGRYLSGVHQAMGYLVSANHHVRSGSPLAIDAVGRHVVIIGGGDTAADCLGVAHRQGAASVTQLDIYPQPPSTRDDDRDPWPTWPWILRNYPAHEEGGDRQFAVAVQEFLASDGVVEGVRIAQVVVGPSAATGRREVTVVPDTVRDLPADLVLLAIGFDGTEEGPLLDQAGLSRTGTGIACGPDWQTAAHGVFVAGDMHRGASLVVWAIAEGRAAAAAIHAYLGADGHLPAPVDPLAVPLRAR
jgi:glutamate synthase (NADPH/NADH) small chain